MGGPDSAQDVTREDVRNVFAGLDQPSAPITAPGVADRVACTPQAARRVLEELAERDELQTRQLGPGTRVWWRPERSTDEREDGTEFEAFVSAVTDYAIITLDPDGTVASWNEGANRITGYETDEIVGEHVSAFYTDAAIADGAPERNLDIAREDGRVEDEGWRVRADGSRFWANVTITAVRDEDGTLQGFTTVTRDMTERRAYEQQLQRERDFTEQILETVPVGIGLLTPSGDVVRANQRLADQFGIEPAASEPSSIDAWDLYDVDGEPIPADERPWRRVFETGHPIDDYQCQVDVPEVGRRWLSITAVPLEHAEDDELRIVLAVDDITEQKEQERDLRREYEQTEKLLRTAPVGIAVQNADRETILANRRAQETFGLTESEFTDNPVDTGEWKIYDADGELLGPEETTSGRVLQTGEPIFDEELIFEPPDGERLHFRVNTAPVFGPDGEIERIITGSKDITELKERERQLEQRKSELETELSEILDRISDAFYALDDEFRFTHLNDHAAELVGRPKAQILDQKVWDVVPDGTEDRHREAFERALETQEPVTFEIYVEDDDAWFEFNAYPSETGLSVYFRDVSERKEYQRKLEESNERLEQFAYAASHDLQEPLRMVTSYLQLLESRYADELDGDAAEFIEFAVDGAERMRKMIDGLLEYSRVETQGEPLEPIDLGEIVDDAIGNLQVKIEETGADITLDSLPQVRGDESQLQQVFQNLLSNALEYSGDEPPRVRISADRRGSRWKISVRDEGIGIEPEDQDQIFEVFQRLHGREEHPGTGIGLSLCQRIVERHDGEISVDSEPGEGTTFSFTLPAA
ncbi:PAS/PAC sensor signal transduction histidine kinase (plasmid) [Haloterrigena turkmenica DSM 5511]|uniref:histidine kinase n=1 Tax=Haloterrigena turkmenica (strain ATCC 51198 / DSM 5511 / JCM 9101 / NCIMB 13204 / VKM B-1734 / 4k) TaxID=543526 RepID=D2S0C3_HALTV|nr:PAS domain S-box protein [Haloterrigena turkmenica]ADB62820.1 PAS/PAC sensor signal transduction histidine kinase [Haloterrigena turkmenica DSM 5511]